MNNDTIGTAIMKKRKQLGYTQQKLADYLHVSFHGGVIIGLN